MDNQTPRASSRKPWRALLAAVVVAVVGAAVLGPLLWRQVQAARYHAIRAYVLSVCSAVEDYHQQHGQYPPSLAEIDRTRLDYDMGIPLEELDYRPADDGYQVAYRRSGRADIVEP